MARTRFLFISLLLVTVTTSWSQVNRYIVLFKDKTGSSYSISDPSKFLSAKALTRRSRQNISVTVDDLPVNQNYIQGLRDAGAAVFFKTRWMNGALVQCNSSLITTLQNLDFVQSVEFVAPNKKLMGNGRQSSDQKKDQDALSGASTRTQLELIGIDQMQAKGYRGEGITIAVLDAGFPGVNVAAPFQDLRKEGRIDLTVSHDFIGNTDNIFQYDAHGTEVLSTIAAQVDGTFTGGAYKANFQLYVTEDVSTEYRIEEYNWLFAAERADSAGADIISTSLGYNEFDDPSMDYKKSDLDGNTAVISRAAQGAADRGILVVCSAGNEGSNSWGLITVPADAKDVLAVANVDMNGIRSVTSSIGPSADGRIKPDLAALGTNVSVVTPNGNLGSVSGTSLSAPLITGLVAGILQEYPDFTNKKIIAALRKTASQASHPDAFLGYGIPNYKAVENYLNFIPQEKTLQVFYTNPFTDKIIVSPRSPEEITSCRIEILTTQGQLMADQVAEFDWLNTTYSADLSHLSSGIYFMRIWLNSSAYVFKVMKN